MSGRIPRVREDIFGSVVCTLIENFRLTFKDGKVIDFAAQKEQEALQNLLDLPD